MFAVTATCCTLLCSAEALAQSTELESLKALPNPTEATPNSSDHTVNPATTVRIPLQGSAQYDGPIETPRMALPGRASMAPPKTYRGWFGTNAPCIQLANQCDGIRTPCRDFRQVRPSRKDFGKSRFAIQDNEQESFDTYDLSNAQVVIIDCGPNNLSWNAGIKIRDFVINGGYLLTTDWMIDRLNQHVFPGFIAWNGATNRQKMYEASIVGKHPALFRHAVTNGAWKMDIHCHLIRIFNKEKVRVLAVSDALAQERSRWTGSTGSCVSIRQRIRHAHDGALRSRTSQRLRITRRIPSHRH